MYALSFDVRNDTPFVESDDVSYAGNVIYIKQMKTYAFPLIIYGIIVMIQGFKTEAEAKLYREALTDQRH